MRRLPQAGWQALAPSKGGRRAGEVRGRHPPPPSKEVGDKSPLRRCPIESIERGDGGASYPMGERGGRCRRTITHPRARGRGGGVCGGVGGEVARDKGGEA